MANEYLKGFLSDAKLQFEEVIFNITDDNVDDHEEKMADLAKRLAR
jgi:hypothetical protein